MNILIFLAAGVTVGWAANKLYHSFSGEGQSSDDEVASVEVEDSKKAKFEDEKDVIEDGKGGDDSTDDLGQLKGVGPKLLGALDEIGIYNFQQLSSSSVDMLLEQLRETGGRFTRASISSIVERAKLAAQ